MKGHKGCVNRVCWDPNNASLVASISADQSLRLWDVRSQTSIAELSFSQFTGKNVNLCWHPDGSTLAVGNLDNVVSFVDVKTFKRVNQMSFPSLAGGPGGQQKSQSQKKQLKELNEMCWNMQGNLFFVTTGTGAVEVLSYPTLETMIELNGHVAPVYCITMDPTGKHFATGGTDAIVSLWDLEEGACVSSFSNVDSPVRTLGFSHCGNYLAYASEEKSIYFVDACSGKPLHEEQTMSRIQQLAFSPTSDLIAYVGDTEREKGKDVLTLARVPTV